MMNTQMARYRATRNFGMSGMSIERGMTIDFDGYNVVVAGRPPQPLPTFKGALKAGWAVPEASYNASAPMARPQPAGIKVRPADTGNPNETRAASSLLATAEAEEQVVGDYREHAAGVRQANNARAYRGSQEVEPQDGVPVRTLQTIANSRGGVRTTLTGSNTNQAIVEANRVQIEAGRGITREELMERMSPEQREQYKAEIEARRAAYVPLDERVAVQGPESQGTVIARLEAPEAVETMGIRTTTTVGGGTETIDLSGLDEAPAQLDVVESEGMRFRTTNGPRKANVGSRRPPSVTPFEDVDPRRVIARAVCRDFPDLYDFDAPLRKKVARLRADFEDRPDVIRAVAAAETDSEMRTLMVAEFPEAFEVVDA